MATRKIEIFSAGCPVCEETVALVNRIAVLLAVSPFWT